MRVDNGEGGVVNLLTRQGSWEPDKQDYAVFFYCDVIILLCCHNEPNMKPQSFYCDILLRILFYCEF